MKVRSESEVTQSCLTLRDPMDCSLPGFSVHGIFQARVPEWVWWQINYDDITILPQSKVRPRLAQTSTFLLTACASWKGPELEAYEGTG